MNDNIHEDLVIQDLNHIFDDVVIDEILGGLLFRVPGDLLVLLLLQIGMVLHFFVV